MYGIETSGVLHDHGNTTQADGAAPGGSFSDRQPPCGYTLRCLIALLRLSDRDEEPPAKIPDGND